MFQKYFPFYKRLLKLALPLVLTQAGQTIVHLVDNAMVGRVGTTELAASSFAGSVFVVIMVFGIGLFLGITPLIGHALGANDDAKVASVMKNSMTLSFFLITALTVLSWSVSYLMPYMGQPDEVVKLAIPYYRQLSVSLFPFLVFMVLKQIGEGLNNTVLAMISTVLSNVINVVLNYLLIFGKFGFPELGLEGAGLATIIARVFMPLFMIVGYRYVKSINRYSKMLPAAKTSWAEFRSIIAIGLPIAGQMVIEVTSFAFSAVMMGWIGDVPLAAHQVAMGMASFTFMIANGVAMAVTIRVSYQLGLRDFTSMEKVAFSSVHLVLAYMSLCGLAFMLLKFQLPKLFTPDPEVIVQAAALLMVAALFQFFDGLQVVCLGILRGFADVKTPMLIAGISYLLIGLPVSYLFGFILGYGPEGIWFGFVAGLATAGILLAFRIRHMIRKVETQNRPEPPIKN